EIEHHQPGNLAVPPAGGDQVVDGAVDVRVAALPTQPEVGGQITPADHRTVDAGQREDPIHVLQCDPALQLHDDHGLGVGPRHVLTRVERIERRVDAGRL